MRPQLKSRQNIDEARATTTTAADNPINRAGVPPPARRLHDETAISAAKWKNE
jgi:hypothetical protein